MPLQLEASFNRHRAGAPSPTCLPLAATRSSWASSKASRTLRGVTPAGMILPRPVSGMLRRDRELDQADHLSCSLRQSSSLRRSAISSAMAGVFALAIGLPSAVTNFSPSTSTGKSSGLRGLSFGMSPSRVKRKSRPGITPSGFSRNCQSARFRCWNDNVDPREKFLPQQGILSRYGPFSSAGRVVERSGAAAYSSNGLLTEATRGYCWRGQQAASSKRQISPPGTFRYQRLMIHFAPTTISQTAAVATANTMTAASKAIESRTPSSSR
jgi:hypothetical protein